MVGAKGIVALMVLLYVSSFATITINEENNILFNDPNDLKIYAFTDPHCSACISALASLPEEPIVYDLREGDAGERYQKIMELTDYVAPGVPLIGIIKDNRLMLIVSGSFSSDEWKKMLTSKYEGVPIYVSERTEPIKVIEDEDLIETITKLFVAKGYENSFEDALSTSLMPVTAIITAALIDSINPCELYILTVLLSLVFFRVGKREVLKVGLIYALGVFLSYICIGFGLIHLLVYSTIVRYVVVITGITVGLRTIINLAFGSFGISVGLREIISSIFRKKFKRVPNAISTIFSSYLRRAASNPLTALIIGILSGLLLSPCTSGPYFIALSLISSLQNPSMGLLLLLIYNLIFILPMVIITLGIYALRITTRDLKKISSQNHRILNLITGLLMIFLSIYLLKVST